MNGQNWRPPDKGNANKNPTQDEEMVLNGIEMKQEPIIKMEHENTADIVNVPATVIPIGSGQTGDTYDFTDVCDLNEAKPEVKKEKVDKESEKGLAEDTGQDAIALPMADDARNIQPKKRQSKPKRASLGSKKAKNFMAKTRNTRNESTCHSKKKPTTSTEKDKQHKCSSCDYTTSHKSHLNTHIRKHTGEKPFPCTYCTKRFTQKQNLQSHMRTHVSEFLFSCSNCLKEISQSDGKLEHEANCKIRRFECHLCKEYSSFQRPHLQYHMRMHHTGEKPFGCDQCSKKFIDPKDLNRHMKTHTNPRPLKFKCSVCYRKFSQKMGKDEHEAKCKYRGYECYVCKEFTSYLLCNLKDHMRTHTGVKPFQCKICQKSFSHESNLKAHVNRIHKYKMNGRSSQPPDKSKQNETPHQDNESILNGIEIKQELIVKLEPENIVNMITVPASERAASGSIVDSIGGDQNGGTHDFTDFRVLDEAKSDLKKEETEKGSAECSGKGAFGSPSSRGAKNLRSNKKQSKPKRDTFGSKNAKKRVATAKNKTKGSSCSNKKKETAPKNIKQHKCSSCDYIASQKGHLNDHIRKHTGEKPFPCIHCAKRFTQKSNLQSHLRTHVSEFSFNCSNCLKGFSQRNEKLEHEANCKIRRFECHLCKEYSTLNKSNFEYHMFVHHTGEKPFGCDQCSKKFIEAKSLNRHMKSHIHPRPLKFKCSVCYRNFPQRIEKDEHEAKCKRRGYECYVCKEFTSYLLCNLKDHMRTHTGLKPFHCKICRKSFSQKSSLKAHVNRIHK